MDDRGEELVAGGDPQERLGDGRDRVVGLSLMGAETEEAAGISEHVEADAGQVFAVIGEHGKELVGGIPFGRLPAAGGNPHRGGGLTGGRDDLGDETEGVRFGRGTSLGRQGESALDAGAIGEPADEGDAIGGGARLGDEFGEERLEFAGEGILHREGEGRLIVTGIEDDHALLGDIGEFLLQADLPDGATTIGERHLEVFVLEDEGLGRLKRHRTSGLTGGGQGGRRLGDQGRSGGGDGGGRGRRGARRRGGRLGEEEKGEGADNAGHTQEEVLAIHGK